MKTLEQLELEFLESRQRADELLNQCERLMHQHYAEEEKQSQLWAAIKRIILPPLIGKPNAVCLFHEADDFVERGTLIELNYPDAIVEFEHGRYTVPVLNLWRSRLADEAQDNSTTQGDPQE